MVKGEVDWGVSRNRVGEPQYLYGSMMKLENNLYWFERRLKEYSVLRYPTFIGARRPFKLSISKENRNLSSYRGGFRLWFDQGLCPMPNSLSF
ncbi:MAG: hypothetical protein Ct9H90mP27_1400 [Gammaproteobacteria bacterium]|nr:MAG: hypothetical protein Ct9H90mP27_1400 [Gammaproteobacteria bacterium]